MSEQVEEVVIVLAATVLLVGVIILAIPDSGPSTPVKVEQSEPYTTPSWPYVVRTIMPEDLDRVDGN